MSRFCVCLDFVSVQILFLCAFYLCEDFLLSPRFDARLLWDESPSPPRALVEIKGEDDTGFET